MRKTCLPKPFTAAVLVCTLLGLGCLFLAVAQSPKPAAIDPDAWRTVGRKWFRGGDAPLDLGKPLAAPWRDCAACHAEIATEWRQSLHSRSWTDPFFQKAYVAEPVAFCRNCHAPAVNPLKFSANAANDGISCAVCHVRAGVVFGSKGRAADGVGHAVVASRDFGSAGFCGGCHQFGFLTNALSTQARFETADPQQDTFAEWSQSPHSAAGRDCRSCHMPQRKSGAGFGHSHRFLGADPVLLAQAVTLTVVAQATQTGTTAQICLKAQWAGHAFPTGDLFRRGLLRVWTDQAPATVGEFALARDYGAATGMDAHRGPWHAKRAIADFRVPPTGQLEVEIALSSQGTLLHWQLCHDNMGTPDPLLRGADKPLQRIVIAQGVVPIHTGGAAVVLNCDSDHPAKVFP